MGRVLKFLKDIVSELDLSRQQLLGVSQTRKLEQRVDGLQMLSADTFGYRNMLHPGQVVPVIIHTKGDYRDSA